MKPPVPGATPQQPLSWNQLWNQGWNTGYNNPNASYGSSGGYAEGANAGKAEYGRRYPVQGPQSGFGTIPMSSATDPRAINYRPPTPPSVPSDTVIAPSEPPPPPPPPVDLYAREQEALKNEISSSWDTFLTDLSTMSKDLTTQETAQRGIQDTQLQQALNVANEQKAKSLRDIGKTTRTAFQAGNNYLGQLGAGDSSASAQYTYALTQQALKQTGDLNNFVQAQTQKLQSDRDAQVKQIELWFVGKQMELKQLIANGQLSKGTDINKYSKSILDTAMKTANEIKIEKQNQQNALLTWAANNSTNIEQLQSKIVNFPQILSQIRQYGGTSNQIPFGQGAVTSSKEKNIFEDFRG